MGIPYQVVYDAFLAKVKEDDWSDASNIEMMLEDWRSILESAIPFFKFPRISLNRNDEGFIEKLGTDEVQILANLMKEEWLSRTINTWENVKVMYDERDWSPANLLRQFISLLDRSEQKALKLERLYSRSITDEDGMRKPFDFSQLAGKK